MYSCDQCESRFTRIFNLTRHKDSRCKPITVIKGLVREVYINDIGEQDVPRKRLWDNCAGLNAAADKTSKNPKIRDLIDEIINDGSTGDHTTPPEKKSPVDVFGEKALPTMVGSGKGV